MLDSLVLSALGPLFTMEGGDWAIVEFLGNIRNKTSEWIKIIIIIIGLIMMVVGVFWIARNLLKKGGQAVAWPLALATFFIGGAMVATGGYNLMKDIAQGQKKTLEELGHSIVVYEQDYGIVIDDD